MRIRMECVRIAHWESLMNSIRATVPSPAISMIANSPLSSRAFAALLNTTWSLFESKTVMFFPGPSFAAGITQSSAYAALRCDHRSGRTFDGVSDASRQSSAAGSEISIGIVLRYPKSRTTSSTSVQLG